MARWKTIRVRQELVEEVKKEVEKSQYKNLSEFVSDAIRARMQTLAKERVSEYLERDRYSRVPFQLFYTPKHLWVQVTPQRKVKIGITDYFLDHAKEIVNIQTDKAEENVYEDEPFGVVESWWFTYDLYSPLNGKIVSVNKAVTDNPFALNVDPYQWIVEVQPEHVEVDSLMTELLSLGEYKKLIMKPEGRIH